MSRVDEALAELPPFEREIAPLIKWLAGRYADDHSTVISFEDLMQTGLTELLTLSRKWRGVPRADRKKLITVSLVRNLRRIVFDEYKTRNASVVVDEAELASIVDEGVFNKFYFEELCDAVESTLGPVHLDVLRELLFPSRVYVEAHREVKVCNWMGSEHARLGSRHARTVKALAVVFKTKWRVMQRMVDEITTVVGSAEVTA